MFNLHAHAESIFLNQEEKKSKGKKKRRKEKKKLKTLMQKNSCTHLCYEPAESAPKTSPN